LGLTLSDTSQEVRKNMAKMQKNKEYLEANLGLTHKNLITFAFSKTYAVKDWFCGKLTLVSYIN